MTSFPFLSVFLWLPRAEMGEQIFTIYTSNDVDLPLPKDDLFPGFGDKNIFRGFKTPKTSKKWAPLGNFKSNVRKETVKRNKITIFTKRYIRSAQSLMWHLGPPVQHHRWAEKLLVKIQDTGWPPSFTNTNKIPTGWYFAAVWHSNGPRHIYVCHMLLRVHFAVFANY